MRCNIHFLLKPPFALRSPARPARQDAQTAHGLHVAAAAGAGEAVPDEQVPLQAEAVRGGHQSDADGDTGEETFSFIDR